MRLGMTDKIERLAAIGIRLLSTKNKEYEKNGRQD